MNNKQAKLRDCILEYMESLLSLCSSCKAFHSKMQFFQLVQNSAYCTVVGTKHVLNELLQFLIWATAGCTGSHTAIRPLYVVQCRSYGVQYVQQYYAACIHALELRAESNEADTVIAVLL